MSEDRTKGDQAPELSQEMKQYFRTYWGNFPFPVMLVHRTRIIMERNALAEALGCVPGARCSDQGTKESHKGCLANLALREQSAQRRVGYLKEFGMILDAYWIPLVDFPDYFLHFSIDITEYAAEHMKLVEL